MVNKNLIKFCLYVLINFRKLKENSLVNNSAQINLIKNSSLKINLIFTQQKIPFKVGSSHTNLRSKEIYLCKKSFLSVKLNVCSKP